MRIWSRILIFSLAAFAFACGGPRAATPLETFKTYTKAVKQKDYTTMKLLLSDATIKMHEQEAKAQGVTVDDIVKRETLLRRQPEDGRIPQREDRRRQSDPGVQGPVQLLGDVAVRP